MAEEAANRALYQLEQARARITAVEAEARVMEQYRDLGSCSQWEIVKNNVSVIDFWFLYCHSQSCTALKRVSFCVSEFF